MKKFKSKILWVTATILLSLGYIISCTKNNQILNAPSGSTTTLTSYKTKTAPVIDGIVDAIWANAIALNVTPTVPNPGNSLFYGYNGQMYPATIQSMYDDSCIYFLVQWNDSTDVQKMQPWTFNQATQQWYQRPNADTYDSSGNLTKLSMGLDQLAFQWNIDNSTVEFPSQTCYASCHVFTPYKNFAGQWVSNANSGNHYTDNQTEKVDLWWAKLNRDILSNQMDDWYIDWSGGPQTYDTLGGNANGRHANGQIPPYPYTSTYILPSTGAAPSATYNGPISNSQTLSYYTYAGGKVKHSEKVPIFVEPGTTNLNFYPLADTASGIALRVVSVDSTGTLTLSNNATLNPNGDAGYNDDPGIGRNIGPKCIPSFISQPFNGARANITASAKYTGTGWVVEIKRKLKTGDVLKQDVDFTSLQDQPFGMAIFNTANNQHGIQPNLLLTFQK